MDHKRKSRAIHVAGQRPCPQPWSTSGRQCV